MNNAFDVLDRAAANHKPRAFYALFSGGHDSLSATAIAHKWAKARGVEMWCAHINTGTGVPETSEFVRSVCRDNGWSLREVQPPRSYESIIMEFGFPGPGFHDLPYNRLKERCLAQLTRESKKKWKDRVMFVTGVRRQESVRRMAHVEEIQRNGAKVWAAPIWDWTKLDCNRFISEQGLPRNPVVDMLHMSGECLCGSFARPGELKEIANWYPEIAERIHALELEVEATGHPACVWGKRPPKINRFQQALFGRFKFMPPDNGRPAGMLCQDCEARAA